jgi:carboxyl-terminal processing protease
MDALIAEMRADASALRLLSPSTYELAIVDYGYETRYVGAYRTMASLAKDMTDILVSSFYLDRLSDESSATDALIYCYMSAVGDRYASYYNEEEFAAYMADNAASYGGIGVTVTQLQSGYVEVIAVTPGSPAEEKGLAIGDLIVAVEGEDFVVLGYTAAINKIRGENGTDITITVERNGERFDVTMTRKTLTEYTVTYKMLATDEKIGFVRISQFDEGTFGQFRDAITALNTAGAEKYVFDVRNNPGGRLDAVLAVLDYILPDGTGTPLIRMQFKDETVSYNSVFEYIDGSDDLEALYADAKNHQITAPIAVLANGYTASAGELFTSCLSDFGVAEVIGTTTYGKGTGQSGFYLTDYYAYVADGEQEMTYYKEALVNISTFRYSPPISDNYEGIGITPDREVELSKEAAAVNFYKLSEELDNQLGAAISYLTERVGVPNGAVNTEEPTNIMPVILWTLFSVLAAVAVGLSIFLIIALRASKGGADDSFFSEEGNTRPEDGE